MAARDRLQPQILPVPNESVRFVAESLRRVPSRMRVGNLTPTREQVYDTFPGNKSAGVTDEEKEVNDIHGAIRDLLPSGGTTNSLGMTHEDVSSMYPDKRWSKATWEAAFQVLPSTRPYKLGFVKYPDTISDCLDTEFFDITIIELGNGSKCSLSVEEHSALIALCSEAELSDEDKDYVFGIMKARLDGVLQGGRCWQKKLDMPKFKCANSSYSLLMFNFIAGHMCLWGRTADWTMLHVTTRMLAIKKGEEEVVPPTPLPSAQVTPDDDKEWTMPALLRELLGKIPVAGSGQIVG